MKLSSESYFKILILFGIIGVLGWFAKHTLPTTNEKNSFLNEFSYTLPKNWTKKGLLGKQILIVSSQLNYGIEANVLINHFYNTTTSDAVKKMVSEKNKSTRIFQH